MSSRFLPLEIPPGVVSTATKKMRSSNYSEVNMVRWVEGRLEPVGGQSKFTYSFASNCRAIHTWYDLSGVQHIAYLCETNLYIDTGGTLTEITPPGGISDPTVPGFGGYSDGLYSAGTYGTPRPETGILAETVLPSAWSLDNFGQILLAQTSSDGRLLQWNPANGSTGVIATLASTGAWTTTSPNIAMTANPGTVQSGMAVFNASNQQIGTVLTYTGTALVLTANAAYAGASGDNLTFGNVATIVPGAPHGRGFVVTSNRFVWMYGTSQDGTTDGGSMRRFGWCSQENLTDWNYASVTNTAGFLDIEPASPIITAISTKTGVLFFTGKKAYVSRYIGLPYVHDSEELADNCAPWSPESIINTSALTLWMSQQGMFSFDGTAVLPVQCLVRDWIENDFDPVNIRDLACAVHVAPYSEFWWFFPQYGMTKNTRAAIYNYKEGWWSQADMPRSAGITASYTSVTIMADGTNAYQHEFGLSYVNAPLPWAETFDLNLNSGSRLTTVKQLLPDIDGASSGLSFSLFYRNFRAVGPAEIQTVPVQIGSTGFVDFRTTGRDIRLRFAVSGPLVPMFTMGAHLIDAVMRGDR